MKSQIFLKRATPVERSGDLATSGGQSAVLVCNDAWELLLLHDPTPNLNLKIENWECLSGIIYQFNEAVKPIDLQHICSCKPMLVL